MPPKDCLDEVLFATAALAAAVAGYAYLALHGIL